MQRSLVIGLACAAAVGLFAAWYLLPAEALGADAANAGKLAAAKSALALPMRLGCPQPMQVRVAMRLPLAR
jgi:hypothetical protein